MFISRRLFSVVFFAIAIVLVSGVSFPTIVHAAATDVTSCADFENINNSLDGDYVLTTNIDCTDEGNAIMVGTDGSPFTGTFDGQGHKITVNINVTGSDYVGLFRAISDPGTRVENLWVSGTIAVTNQHGTGAVVGETKSNSTVSEVVSDATITSNYYNVGGLIGEMTGNSLLADSYFVGSVTANINIGGLVGSAANAEITTSYAAGEIHTDYFHNWAGGLVGHTFNSAVYIIYSFNASSMDTNGGGLIGYRDDTLSVSDSYYDATISGATACDHEDVGGSLTGCTAIVGNSGYFKDDVTSTAPFAGGTWNFTDTWEIATNDYPRLKVFEALYPVPTYAGGVGTPENPYQITTCAGIEDIDNHLSASYVLNSDIDCTSAQNDIIVRGQFSGTFNGNGHTITLYIDTTDDGIGLFEILYGAHVKNLHLSGQIMGGGLEGALAGTADNGTIIQYVGSDVSVSTHTGSNLTGGLVGLLTQHSLISNSFSTGEITADGYATGGLVGSLFYSGSIDRSYASGAVHGGTDTGGLVGKGDTQAGSITQSFQAGHVDGGPNTGSIIGERAAATLADDYFDADINGLGAVCAGDASNACTFVNGEGSNPNYFINNSENPPFPEWDFNNVWITSTGKLPYLRTPVTASMAYYPLDDISGSFTQTTPDLTGFRDATLHGATLPSRVTGNFQHALSFNGSNYASTSLPFSQSGTISLWAYPTTTGAGISPAGWKLTGPGNGYVLLDEGDGSHWRANFQPDIDGASGVVVEDLSSIATNQWNHLVMTWSYNSIANETTVHLYVNGVDKGSEIWAGTPGANGLGGFNIGKSGDSNGDYFTGKIDEVRVYDYALGAGEVADLAGLAVDHVSGVPTVTATSPEDGATGVQTNHEMSGTITFSEAMNPNLSELSFAPCASTCPTAVLGWDNGDTVLGFLINDPNPLAPNTEYTVIVRGQSVEGVLMASPYSFSFTTEDTVTETPIMEITAPQSGSSYKTNETMHFNFTLPELMSADTLSITFTRTDTDASDIVLNMKDANAEQENIFDLPLNNLAGAEEVVLAHVMQDTVNNIPAGTYTITLSYQDAAGNPAATASISNIVIAEPTVTSHNVTLIPSGPGSIGHFVSSSGTNASDCQPGFLVSPNTGQSCIQEQQPTAIFLKDLKKGMVDPDVSKLQHYLDLAGFPVALTGPGSLNHETTTFGSKTVIALKKFQKAHGIPATGFFGPKTRAYVNAHLDILK